MSGIKNGDRVNAYACYLDGVHGGGAEGVMWPVLRVPVEEDVERGQVVPARHRRALETEVVGQLVDEEERRLVAIAAEHQRAVFELGATQQLLPSTTSYNTTSYNRTQVCRWYGDPYGDHHGYGYGVGMGIEIPSPRQP